MPMTATNEDRSLRWYAAREPIILGVLTLLAIAGFVVVGALSNLFHRQQQVLGNSFYQQGTADASRTRAASRNRVPRCIVIFPGKLFLSARLG